jgi:hypothetical protein
MEVFPANCSRVIRGLVSACEIRFAAYLYSIVKTIRFPFSTALQACST